MVIQKTLKGLKEYKYTFLSQIKIYIKKLPFFLKKYNTITKLF